ncbi:MAG: protein kinase [Gemmataceae bacterium]|nr:protein kinase [Gemmataceae bacterium]
MNKALCPDEEVLFPLIFGEPTSDEVKSHVSSCDSCQQRIERIKTDVASLRQTGFQTRPTTVSDSPRTVDEPAVKRPATIGRFFIVGSLDKGGQGEVFRALHPTLGKDVAIKVSHKKLNGDTERDRLVAEGKLLAELDHPNLARVFDLDFHEGRPFLVMEYVRGQTLEQRAELEKFAPADAAVVVAQLARALATAHRRGVTHQDVKPRNILMDETGKPRLIDFGIARLRNAWSEGGQQPVGGTLGYMAPEQARGEADRIGPRSDIFALGGVLYFLLTGEPPFAGTNAYLVQQQTTQGKLDLALLKSKGAPRALAAVCRRALSADPSDRYPNSDMLADDLDHFLRRPRRMRALALGGVAAVLMLLAGFAIFYRPEPVKLPDKHQELIHQVRRGPQERAFNLGKLQSAIPLFNGDRFRIQCNVPRGFHVAIVMLDSEGKLASVPGADIDVVPAGEFDQVTYPKADGLAQLNGPPGTEFLLVVASRHRLRVSDVGVYFADAGAWPALPDDMLVRVDLDGVAAEKGLRGVGVTRGDSLSGVEARLQKLQGQLKGAGYEYFIGVAYPHVGN